MQTPDHCFQGILKLLCSRLDRDITASDFGRDYHTLLVRLLNCAGARGTERRTSRSGPLILSRTNTVYERRRICGDRRKTLRVRVQRCLPDDGRLSRCRRSCLESVRFGLQGPGPLPGRRHPTTWLYRITVNAALMRIRKDKRGKEMTVSEEFRADVASSNWAESPVAAAMNAELGDRIQVAIVELPEDLRVAVVLRDVQGLSNQKAADALDVSVSALKARLHHDRIALRDSLAEYVAERASAG
ncbi:MAG TPA: RNA polymerase sigma factor [Dehalococcoidia bacterium]|nr:RNA polymerase sigma factor [Dehalococcoidia bacterium]